jgi:glutamate racemase
MIGVFDSGHGGLVVYRRLVKDFPDRKFVYYGDHLRAPYGNLPSQQVIELTRNGVQYLFDTGCRLVLLACNTATAVAGRTLQRDWLPDSEYKNNRVLGIIAPTVEAATLTPWGITTAQYPQNCNRDTIIVFGTPRTIGTNVFREEIQKRCPQIRVSEYAIPDLAGAIEMRASPDMLDAIVKSACENALQRLEGRHPDKVILGCTHFPIVENLFMKYLPPSTRILCQAGAVSDSLQDYLRRKPEMDHPAAITEPQLFTSGDAEKVSLIASFFMNDTIRFKAA